MINDHLVSGRDLDRNERREASSSPQLSSTSSVQDVPVRNRLSAEESKNILERMWEEIDR